MSSGKSDRSSETRELLLVTAERLFAEHGVEAVSNRQVSEAAGQSNNFAVGYHFGTKEELVVAIVRRHYEPIERRRSEMLAEIKGEAEVLVRQGMTERRHIELFSFVEGINDVYLVATVVALLAVPLSLGIRKKPVEFQAAVEAR
ncbi:MAG TPA: helix-turn-helix domain-containing protein [Archangium sp.]|uniref:TetR/AcrR family transcriptional regulator n=1 Tax=Archangium sp. TaxID=1872627 RepID=UPI002E331D01|nr:helix-turn-helix domain-containing protein [Archangium sp.]HEX5746632.1 helix-turn-helix domain-containing protein [Archangium sp.]